MVDCSKCVRRGKVNGLSQESYCSGCVHGTPWKKDFYSEGPSGGIPNKNCDGCARDLPVINGLHIADRERFACTSHLYR